MARHTVLQRRLKSKPVDLFSYAHGNRAALLYKITNRVDGKFYIGVTRLTLEARFKKHVAEAKRGSNRNFCRAIRAHGAENFGIELLNEFETFKMALIAERASIAELNPSYNTTDGGQGVLGMRHSDASKSKMSKAKAGRAPWGKGECPQEVREKLAEAGRRRRGEKRSAVGAAVNRESSRKANAARRRRVECLNSGLQFNSVTDAAAHFGIHSGHISNWCGGMKSRVGIRVRYIEDDLSGDDGNDKL